MNLQQLRRKSANRWLSSEQRQASHDAFLLEARKTADRLPFAHSTAYAYSPHENVGSGGTSHIIVDEPLQAGRLIRKPGDALCKPAARFWGLDMRPGRPAECLRCLEIAERLTNSATHAGTA